MNALKYILCICMGLCAIFTGACSNMSEKPKLKKEIIEQCWGNRHCEGIIEEYPVGSEANVLMPSMIKAYGIGRYQDPVDSRIMHERHVVYRLEQEPRWRYNVDSSKQILIGNTISASKCTYQPALLDKEIAIELQKQRAINKNLQLTYKKILDVYETIEKTQTLFLKNIEQFHKTANEMTPDVIPSANNPQADLNHITIKTSKL